MKRSKKDKKNEKWRCTRVYRMMHFYDQHANRRVERQTIGQNKQKKVCDDHI